MRFGSESLLLMNANRNVPPPDGETAQKHHHEKKSCVYCALIGLHNNGFCNVYESFSVDQAEFVANSFGAIGFVCGRFQTTTMLVL